MTNPTVAKNKKSLFTRQKHPFHFLGPSPFPLLTGFFLFCWLTPLTFYMHGTYFSSSEFLNGVSVLSVAATPTPKPNGIRAKLRFLYRSLRIELRTIGRYLDDIWDEPRPPAYPISILTVWATILVFFFFRNLLELSFVSVIQVIAFQLHILNYSS